jgi:thioredoxin-like negative regulator of GroEL
MSVTAKVTDASFDTDVIKSEEPVVVDFWPNGAGHAA